MRNMLIVLTLMFFLACNSDKPKNDADINDNDLATIDIDTFVSDSSSDLPDEDFDLTARYVSCYDEIPDEPYEGLFADPNLEQQIKAKLEIADDEELKESDLEQITDLYIRQIKDFRGLEKLINLETFGFSVGGNIYDFTPLSGLKKIKKFTIFHNDLRDFPNMNCLDGSFSKLTFIEELEINGTELKDVSPIEQLTNLKILNISKNKIEFLPKNMGNLQKLEELDMGNNKIVDISPLQNLTNLTVLFFHYNKVEDVSALKSLVNLVRLGFADNKISDISVIGSLPNLTIFTARINKIATLPKCFSNLKKLNHLDLSYNGISELPLLTGLSSLKTLYLSHNKISDMTPLDSLENLEVLFIAGNKVVKIPILKNMKSLRNLGLEMNEITNLSGFSDNDSFPALRRLELSDNKIEDAEPLKKREGLGRVSVGKNCIKDLSPLQELKENGCYVSGMDKQFENCEKRIFILKGRG